jgi:hypothetical protein
LPGNTQARPQRARLAVDAQIFGDIGVRDNVGKMPVVSKKPAEVDVFAAGNQRLRQIEGLVERMMPAPSALADVGTAVAGNGDVQDGQFADGFRVRGGDRVSGGPAPVVANQVEFVDIQLLQQPPDIVAHRLLVIARRGT